MKSAHETLTIEDILNNELKRSQFLNRPSVMLGISPKICDNGVWLAAFSSDITDVDHNISKVYGIGNTPDEAMENFDKKWLGG